MRIQKVMEFTGGLEEGKFSSVIKNIPLSASMTIELKSALRIDLVTMLILSFLHRII